MYVYVYTYILYNLLFLVTQVASRSLACSGSAEGERELSAESMEDVKTAILGLLEILQVGLCAVGSWDCPAEGMLLGFTITANSLHSGMGGPGLTGC